VVDYWKEVKCMKIDDILKLGEKASSYGTEIFETDFIEKAREYTVARSKAVLKAYEEYFNSQKTIEDAVTESLVELLNEVRRKAYWIRTNKSEESYYNKYVIDIQPILDEKIELPIYEGCLSDRIDELSKEAEISF
jgi:hypothetical protein